MAVDESQSEDPTQHCAETAAELLNNLLPSKGKLSIVQMYFPPYQSGNQITEFACIASQSDPKRKEEKLTIAFFSGINFRIHGKRTSSLLPDPIELQVHVFAIEDVKTWTIPAPRYSGDPITWTQLMRERIQHTAKPMLLPNGK